MNERYSQNCDKEIIGTTPFSSPIETTLPEVIGALERGRFELDFAVVAKVDNVLGGVVDVRVVGAV